MGLFGSKKTFVASTVQNLAGDELKRPDYLKTTVVGSVLANQEDISDTLNRAYLKGPGMKLRSFFRWSLLPGNYDHIGVPSERTGSTTQVAAMVVGDNVTLTGGVYMRPQTVEIGGADFGYWAEKYILDTVPLDIGTAWNADYNEVTGQIIITWEDNSITSFVPDDFDKDADYLYASYTGITLGTAGSLTTGTTYTFVGSQDTSSWNLVSGTITKAPVSRNKEVTTVVTYSDARPGSSVTTNQTLEDFFETGSGVYESDLYLAAGVNPDDLSNPSKRDETIYLTRSNPFLDEVTGSTSFDEVMEDGVTKTTTVTTTEDVIKYDVIFRLDYRYTPILDEAVDPKVYIYKYGSGNSALDDLFSNEISGGPEYFPFIPVRIDNEFLSESHEPEAYAQAKKAFKKSIDGDINEIISELSDSENLADMDYIYAVFGVSANVLENSCRKYLYDYFHRLMVGQQTTISNFDSWQTSVANYNLEMEDWNIWALAQEDPEDPLYNTDPPLVMSFPNAPLSKITIRSQGDLDTDYQIELGWQWINEVTGIGLAKPGAKKGELWFADASATAFNGNLFARKSAYPVLSKTYDITRLYWQVDETHWLALDIMGMYHRNYIYKGKYVEISLREALADTAESGFIVPLHYPTYKAMSIVDSTQMSTACAFMVFNSYLVKKTGLLGSLIFKIFLIIVIIVVVVYAPQLAPQLAKAAAATGTAVGLSGTTALIVGAAINAIAAMAISSVIMKASIALFGEKLGMIIGTIASIVSANGLANLANGQGMVVNFGNMMSAQNLTMLTSTVGNVYAKFVALEAFETLGKAEDLQKTFDDKQAEIAKLYANNLGYGNGIIDPLALLDSSNMLIETASAFLTRTLLTGSDIAEMSMNMIEAFPELTLSSDLPLD